MAGVGTAYPADYSATYSGPQYTAQQGRTAMAAAMAGATAARPLGGISGVRPGTPNVASATSTTWTVTPFGGYIDLETSASNGGYFFSFLSNSTGTVSAAEGSARVDLLYVQIADTNTGDSTTVAPRVILDYQKGTAGAGVPALAAPRAFVIAQINVPATGGGAPTVTWVAPYAVAAGGILPIDTLAHLTLIAGASAQYAEVTADPTTTNNGLYHWIAGAWVPVLSDTGWITPTLINGWSSVASETVKYARLNGIVMLTGQGTGGTDGNLFVLPVGFRPAQAARFIVLNALTTATGARVVVDTTGAVIVSSGTQPNLAQVMFRAEQ